MIQVRVNKREVEASAVNWSSVDPGGFESCSFVVPRGGANIAMGYEILITDGMEVCFHGLVEEPGLRTERGIQTYNVVGVGYNVLLKRNPYSMVYIERRLSQFEPPSPERELERAANAGGYVMNDQGGWELKVGEVTGNSGGFPALVFGFTNMVTTAARHPTIEAWYDAGYGNAIREVLFQFHTFDKSAGGYDTLGGSWVNDAFLANSTNITNFDVTGVSGASGIGSLIASANNRRYLAFRLYYSAVTATGAGDWKWIIWYVRMIGWHNLKLRPHPIEPDGFFPSDIAADAAGRSKAGFDLVVDDSSSFYLSQCVYKDLTAPDQIIDDMSKYVGWHWGVWEPANCMASIPRFFFTAPPSTPTVITQYSDCQNIDLTEKLSDSYNIANVRYSLSSGKTFSTVVQRDNPRLASDVYSAITIDVGVVGSETGAKAIGLYQLALLQDNARMAGSLTLPTRIGGRDSHLLRPGRDKIKILGIPTLTSLLTNADSGLDQFRIRRMSVTVEGGIPRTQIEFDHGADLIEVLQARLTNALERQSLS